MIYSQKGIYEYLVNNPLGVAVNVGDLEDLNGEDYIFLDFLSEDLIGYDDKGTYRTELQITIACKDFENRKTLTKYVQEYINVSTYYETSYAFEYFLSRNTAQVIIHDDETE